MFLYIFFIHLRQTRNEADISVCKLGQWTLKKKIVHTKNIIHKCGGMSEREREREKERRMKETLNDIMNERGEKLARESKNIVLTSFRKPFDFLTLVFFFRCMALFSSNIDMWKRSH